MPTKTRKPNPVYEKGTQLIEKFLKDPQNTDLKRELSATKKILKNWDFDFLMSVNLGFKLNSLLFLVSARGQEHLNRLFNEKLLDLAQKPQNFELLEGKIGEDVVVEKEPKGLMSFVKK